VEELEDQKNKKHGGSTIGHLCIPLNLHSGTTCSCANTSSRYLSTRPISLDGGTECTRIYS
jgi:hypothetical protein